MSCSSGAGAGVRDVLGPVGVDGVGTGLVGLGRVDLGVGGAVDHHVTGVDEPLGGAGVGDVPLRRGQRQHVAALFARLSCQHTPDQAAGTGDNDPCRHQSRVWHADPRYPVCGPLASSLG